MLAAIEAEQTPLKAQQDAVLDLQGSLAKELSRCDETLSQIAQAQQKAVTGMLSAREPADLER